ncbi:MAG: DUF2262 domain-containing protein, partial [Myxococcota bacterium]
RDPVLGELVFQRSLGYYRGSCVWLKANVGITIEAGPRMVPEKSAPCRIARTLFSDAAAWDARMRAFAAAKWDSMRAIRDLAFRPKPDDLERHFELDHARFTERGRFHLELSCEALLGDHGIEVSGNESGPTSCRVMI